MPLLPSGLSAYNFTYDNWGANPSATPGTSVVPGASNAEGSWTQVASSANIAQDCYWLYVMVLGGATGAQVKSHLLDIGVDPAGGTSYSAIISDMTVGGSSPLTNVGNREFVFPFFIKSGSSVAVRIQGNNATAGTVRVCVQFFGQPTRPETVPIGQFSQTFGSFASSQGTAFTPGNAADGSWVDMGAVTSPLWWFQPVFQISNSATTAEYTYVELAWGDSTNKISMCKVMHSGTVNETTGLSIQTHLLSCAAYNPVPAGANIYIRGRCNNAPDASYNASVIGIGG